MNGKNFEKIDIKTNNHIAMYPSTKFQSIWRNPDYGTKFAQTASVTKILEK